MNRIFPIVLMILGTMVPTVKVMAWASLYFGDYASTHNQIVSWAYDHMGGDNSFSLNQFPHESDVLPWDYVLKEGDHVKGTSPDADNNSKYSMHYYNPEIQEGGGPNAVAKYYGNMLDAIAEKKESVFLNKPAAWCAHFMADMNVPYHVVGTTAEVAYARMKNPVLNEDVTGPHDLYWHPSSIKQLTRPFIPPGWGLSNNFVHALRRFTDTYPPQSDGDWFDPWYLNGGVLEHGFQSDNDMIILGTGSHAIWEAVVMGTYRKVHMQKELDKLVSEDGFYDPLWKDPKPVFGEKVFENAKRQSEEFARAVAKRTRDNILEYWENPALALAHSVRSVSTLYRGSMTAMTLVHTVSEFEPGHYKIAIHVENNGSNYLKGVKGKLFLNGKNMGIVSLGEDLAIGLEDMLVWDYETNRMDLVEAVVEVIGDYDDTPDLGYKKLSFTFKTFEDELAEFSNATFPSNSLFEGNGENINPPSDPVITGPPVNEPDDDNVSLDSLIPMGFTILRKDGDEIVSVPPSDRFYAQVRTFAIDYDPGQEMHHMWTISDPQGTVIFKNSGQVEKDGEGPTTFLLSSKFRSKSRVGNYRFELSIFKGSSPIFQKQGVLKLVPLFEEAKLVIADKPEDPIEYEVFRPGDSIVFIETLKYNSVDPERTVHMDVVLSGTDLAIRALGSNGEYKLSNVNNTFTATASIPGIIQEGLYTVDVNIWSGEESVRITETFSIQHPVEFIGNRTTPGENMNLYKNQFGAGDFFGSFMNYRLKHTRPGDMYSSALFCSIGGYKVEQLSSPVYGPDLVGEENSTSQTYFSSMVPLDMPQGQYLSYGVVWYNGAGYQTGNAYFKLGKVPTITITSPQNGFQVDDKVLVVTGTCEDLDLTEATLLTNGQSYPVKLVNGEFSTKVVLRPGRNDIRITAENDSGESSDSVSGVARINASVLKVVLIWEAAKTDVDLWVTDPEGKVTYYSNKSPGEGRKLDIDDQRGPGAETYTMEKVIPGNYQVDVLYYSAHGYQGSVPFRLEVTSWETTPYESRSSANGVLYKPGGREKKAGSFQTFNFQLKPQMNAFY